MERVENGGGDWGSLQIKVIFFVAAARCCSLLLAALTEPTNMFATLFTLASGSIRFLVFPAPLTQHIFHFPIQLVFSAFICCSSEIKSKKYALASFVNKHWENLTKKRVQKAGEKKLQRAFE